MAPKNLICNFRAPTLRAREKKYEYKRGSNAHLTKPSEYADIPESDFADPVGYNYPIDKEHIRGAITYWQHMDHRKAHDHII
ncbi:MAG: hypothetical protein QXQ94_11095 [Candidatus Bathyarchaeia archaeon]